MSSVSVLRAVARTPQRCPSSLRPTSTRSPLATLVRRDQDDRTNTLYMTKPTRGSKRTFSTSVSKRTGPHEEETFEEFTARYEKEFDGVMDVFELQRNLNNSFAYDLVPSTTVVTAALRAARRVNDFPTAVRIFEGLKVKVENPAQYHQYLEELEPLRKELGIELRETLYPELGDRV